MFKYQSHADVCRRPRTWDCCLPLTSLPLMQVACGSYACVPLVCTTGRSILTFASFRVSDTGRSLITFTNFHVRYVAHNVKYDSPRCPDTSWGSTSSRSTASGTAAHRSSCSRCLSGRKSLRCKPEMPTPTTGAHPILRNAENKKLLTRLGSFTLTSTIRPVGYMT
jgi:hypothetical protein